jgi:hypothetical protein
LKKVFLLIVLFYISSAAQTHLDSISFFAAPAPLNLLKSRFEKQLNTFYLNTGVEYNNTFGRLSLGLYENYNSTFIRSNDKNIRDEHSFMVSTGYNLNPLLDLGLSFSNMILSDNRKIEINEASVSNLIFLTKIQPYQEFSFSPFAGYSNNRQKLENDYGAIYGIGGTLSRLDFTDLTVNSEFLFRNEDISPRKNTNRYFNVNALNNFSNTVENNLNFRYSESRKDFYYDADSVTSALFNIKNNIQSRTESNYLLQNNLFYNNFLDIFRLDLTGRVLWRTIDRDTRYKTQTPGAGSIFDTDINELRMEVESGITYNTRVHRTSLRLVLNQRDEKHLVKFDSDIPSNVFDLRSEQEKRKNNTSVRTSLTLNSDVNLSRKDKMNLSFMQNKLRYDTPSSENYDDRDEILSIARLRYSRMLTPFFEFFTALEGSYSHIVYLYSQQSSNNYVNRILRLNSGGLYKGRNLTSTNSFEVSANYTVYDFEDINPNYRSFSFRQFTAADSSLLKLSRKLGLFFGGYIKLSEQGDLRWRAFSTRPNRYLEELYAEPKLIYNFMGMDLSAGMRFFSLKTFLYKNNIKEINTRYRSTGPVAEALIMVMESLRARFYTWYEFIRLEDKQNREQINLTLNVEWKF